MMNESLTEEELDSLFTAMKSHSEVLRESDSESEVIECVQIVMALQSYWNDVNMRWTVSHTTYFYMRELDKLGVCLCWLSRHAKETENSFKLYTTPQSAPIVPVGITSEQVTGMTT